MTSRQCAGFLDQIQENGGSDVMLEMLRIMVQTGLEKGITRHVGAQPYERGGTRRPSRGTNAFGAHCNTQRNRQ